jgi:hypothetical protein
LAQPCGLSTAYTPLNALLVWSRCGLGERGRDDLRSEGAAPRPQELAPLQKSRPIRPRAARDNVPNRAASRLTHLGHSVVDHRLSGGQLL